MPNIHPIPSAMPDSLTAEVATTGAVLIGANGDELATFDHQLHIAGGDHALASLIAHLYNEHVELRERLNARQTDTNAHCVRHIRDTIRKLEHDK